jgi:Holliday junction DNA helicase RuvB
VSSGPDFLSGEPLNGDAAVDNSLRPRSFDGFVGRARTVDNLKTWINAARSRGEPLDHVLFSGPPGLGKTTLAYIIANEMDATLHASSGPALDRPRDLAGLLTTLQKGDVLFIDEIHRINVAVEEYLYTAMEDFYIDIVIDQGPNARSLRLNLPRFTLVGSTTREGLLTPPLRGRFQILERLDYYEPEELRKIVLNSARILEIGIRPDAAELIARRSRGTPRVANRFLRRIRDVAHAIDAETVDLEIARDGLERLGIDQSGLCELDRRILRAIGQSSTPVGLKTIAAVVGEEQDTVEEVYEPFLVREALVEKTPRGRVITRKAARLIGLAEGEPSAGGLFT